MLLDGRQRKSAELPPSPFQLVVLAGLQVVGLRNAQPTNKAHSVRVPNCQYPNVCAVDGLPHIYDPGISTTDSTNWDRDNLDLTDFSLLCPSRQLSFTSV